MIDEKKGYNENEIKILNSLVQNIGSTQYVKIPFSNCVFTDGINDLINKCGCWWLISDLGIEVSHKERLQKPFLIVTIKVKDNKAIVTLKEDINEKPILIKKYDYTDFPLSEYEFYICDNVFLLKGEY